MSFGETKEYIRVAFEGQSKTRKLPRADLEFAQKETEAEEEDELFDDLLTHCQRFDGGDAFALFDIVSECQELQIVLPGWAADALKRMTTNAILGNPIEERLNHGRHARNSKVEADLLKGFLRHEAVTKVRYYQALGPCVYSYLLLPVGLKRLYAGKELPDLGTTVDAAIEAARQSLSGSFAQCSFETLRKAYRNPDNAKMPSWALASADALKTIGVEVDANEYLPACKGSSRKPLLVDMPSQLQVTLVNVEMDPRSIRIIELARSYEDFGDFVEEVRKGRVVP